MFRPAEVLIEHRARAPGELTSNEALCGAFNRSDYFVSGGLSGNLEVFLTGPVLKPAGFQLNAATASDRALTAPAKSIAFQPTQTTVRELTYVGCADGGISVWNLEAQRLIHSTHERNLENSASNPLNALAMHVGGARFATGGKDGAVRIYDSETVKPVEVLVEGHSVELPRAHTLPISCVAWLDHNNLATASWDCTVQLWDVRERRSVRSILGPYVVGPGIAVMPDGKTLVCASSRSEKQLQLFDLGSSEQICECVWPVQPDSRGVNLTCVRVSPDHAYVAAGGDRDLRIFKTTTLLSGGNTPSGQLSEAGGSQPVFDVAWSPRSDYVVACGSETVVLRS
jgi:WD40 repeat protein